MALLLITLVIGLCVFECDRTGLHEILDFFKIIF